jgi:hypothetical protein
MKLPLLFILSFGYFSITAQIQIGADIDGEAAFDQSGHSVSLSSDGTRVAIGSRVNDGNGSDAGHVRIYKEIGGNWTQVGSDIDGEAISDQSGYSISLSSDGTRIAIGAHRNDGNGSESGHVRIYEESMGSWTQVGSDIDGEAAGDESGWSVSLSSDGTRVAIGARKNDGNGSDAGHVRIYEESIGNWIQIGADIDGEAAGDESGYSVSMSSDGTKVAIGARYNDGNGSNAGHVRIYEEIGGNWTQIGADINGEAVSDESGYSVSLSSDGTRIAIGAYQNDGNGGGSGHVRIYGESMDNWTQIGGDINGESFGDFSGWSVSMSSSGTRVAIGAWANSNAVGHVRLYEESGGSWNQIGTDIDGEATNDRSGHSVSISSDGTRVAIGAHQNDGNGNSSGHVRIYGSLTLPVELINFIGRQDGNKVILEWETAVESNNKGFEIHKSNDGREWEKIDFVNGNGTTTEIKKYQYQDANPFSGINYYRLKQVDLDGAFEYSKIIVVENENLSKVLRVFPNPSTGLFNVEISNSANQRVQIKVLDNLGRRVWESDLVESESNWRKEINIPTDGVYLLTIQIGNEIFNERMVIKN